MHDITTYIKDVLKTLRELKKSSGLAFEMLKLLSDGQESSVVMLITQLPSCPVRVLLITVTEKESYPYYCRICGITRRLIWWIAPQTVK